MRRLFRARSFAGLALVSLAVALSTFACSPPAAAAPLIQAPANTMLHVGSHGKRVSTLQWLLGNHKPNAFRSSSIKGTFHVAPNGSFGPRTAKAVIDYKWQLGYPKRLVKPIAGPYFFALLEGKAKRPIAWVAIAAKRIDLVAAGPTELAKHIRTLELTQLGVQEQPLGSNSGAAVNAYQRVTGAINLAWCVSLQQWAFKAAGAGTFAYDTASVYAAVDWAQPRGFLRARPKVGALVAFVDYDRAGHRIPGTGHMGFISKVTARGFVYIAGNDGNAVREHFLDNADRSHVFIYLPGVAS